MPERSRGPGPLSEEAVRLLLHEGRPLVLLIAAGDTSMTPLLRGGDAILATSWDGRARPGDLLLFRQQDYLVVHRYLGPAKTSAGIPCLKTRGDARSACDPPLLADRVLARVDAIRRGGDWSSLQGRGARGYARLMAWHARFWAATAAVLGRAGLAPIAAAVDRALVAIVAAVVFPLCHRPHPGDPGEGRAKPG